MFGRRYNLIIIASFAMLFILSIIFGLRIRFDYNFEAFFPHGSEDLDFYHEFRNKFEPDDNYILIALKTDKGSVFNEAFLKKVEQFTSESESLPYVDQSISLINQYKPVFFMGAPVKIRLLDPDKPEKFKSDSAKIVNDPLMQGRLISTNANALTVVLKTGHVLSLGESQRFSDELNELVQQYNFDDYHIAGRAYYQSLFVENSKTEFFLYTAVSALLIFIILIIIFRKFWGVAISLFSVLLAMIIFIGALGFFDIPLDPMSTLFPILMIIVGMSDVIHIMSKYVDELNRGMARKDAIRKTVREVGMATFLTTATTAIGFASLFTSSIPPIKNFGITAAIGVFIAYFTIILFTPAVISLFNAHQIIRRKKERSGWDQLMNWLYKATYHHKIKIGISTLLVIGISIIGVLNISTDVHIESNFPKTAKVKDDFRFFEQELGGVRTLEIGLIAKNGYDINDYKVLQQVDSLEQYLVRFDAINSIYSPTAIYKSINRAFKADDPDEFKFPESKETFNEYREIVSAAPASAINIVTSEDNKFGRLSGKMVDMGSDSNKDLREEITGWINQNLDTSIVAFQHTGTSYLFDKNNEYLRESLFYGLGLAFLIISVLMALLFRNWKMVIISLIPNVVPLLIAGAVLGYLGIELDAPTSVIFAIAFGIAVDDTIHFLSKFKLEILKGRTNAEAVRITFLESGKAICLTSIILFFGFIILTTSTYPPTIIIGFLVSLTLISALIADLFIIPVLIYWFMGKDNTLYIRKIIDKNKFRKKMSGSKNT